MVSQGINVKTGEVFNFVSRRYEKAGIKRVGKSVKRRFQRLVSGLQVGVNNNQRMRFLTLTTAEGVTKDIDQSFRGLKLAISRARKDRDGFEGFKFSQYFCLKTSEGNGVLHIVYRGGGYIPQEWISDTWQRLHNSKIVYIEEIDYHEGARNIANYLIVNYLQQQKTLRMSCGWGWLWLGCCKSWANILRVYFCGPLRNTFGVFKNSLSVWQLALKYHDKTSRQLKITRFLT